MARIFANNATTTLADALLIADRTITVTPGTGGVFPAIDNAGAGEWMDMTLEDVNGQIEIVRCITHTPGSDDFTLASDGRGLEGTSAADFNVGTRVELRLTAAALNGWLQKDGDVIDGGDF